MAFQIKDFRSIVASMVNHVRATSTQLTDFRVGSVTRTLLEAPATEMEELYQQMFTGLKEAIPAALYPPFGFDLLPAAPAAVNLTFSVDKAAESAIKIPAGTAVSAPGGSVTYATTEQGVIAEGETEVILAAVASVTGAIGNCGADSLTQLRNPIAGVSVTNEQSVINGRDAETEIQRAARFRAYIASLARSNVQGVGYGASTAQVVDDSGQILEYVFAHKVVEPYLADNDKPLGYVDIYIWNGRDSASSELVSVAQSIVDGYNDSDGSRVAGYVSAGVVATVHPTTEAYIAIHATITAEPGYALSAIAQPIQAAIADYITSLGIGEGFVVSEAIARAMEVAGVANFHTEKKDVAGVVGTKYLAGAVTLDEA
jgi:hypothetical protein